MGDQGTRSPRAVELARIELARSEPKQGGRMHGTGDRLAWKRRLEQSCSGRSRRRPDHVVHVHVVRMSVTAAGVVTDHCVRALVLEDVCDLRGDHVHVDGGEAIGGVSVQTGIGVAQVHHAVYPENFRRIRQFPGARGGHVGYLGTHEPCGSIRRHDQDDSMAGRHRLGHRASGEQCLVVGMGVAEHQGAHRRILAYVPYGHPVRIAHITDCFAPRTGGIETQVLGLAERQIAAGHDVVVLTATPGAGPQRSGLDEVGPVPVVRIAARLPFDIPVHPQTRTHVLRELRRSKVDVVHVHAGAASPFAWGGIRAARQARIPTLVTVHSMWDPLSRTGNRLLDRTAWGMGSGVVLSAVGSDAAERVREALGQPVIVLPNGIDPREWSVTRVPRTGEILRVVSVLRLAPRKRALPLVSVLHRAIAATGGRIRATLIGDGPEAGRVERYIDRHALTDAITLTGRLPHARIRAHFATSDVFVQASIRESFGIAALEARTAGLAIVSRSQAGSSDFVTDGVEGLLGEEDADLVSSLLTLQSEPELLNGIIEHNTAVPPVQAWPNVLEQVEWAYDIARGSRKRTLG